MFAQFGEVEVQRRHRDVALRNGVQVGASLGVGENPLEADPEIGAAARIDPLIHAQERLVALTTQVQAVRQPPG